MIDYFCLTLKIIKKYLRNIVGYTKGGKYISIKDTRHNLCAYIGYTSVKNTTFFINKRKKINVQKKKKPKKSDYNDI